MPTKRSRKKKTSKTAAAAAPAAAADARSNTKKVEKSFVGSSATGTYSGEMVRFSLHLYDNHRNVILDEYLSKFDAADSADKETTRAGMRMKLRTAIMEAIKEIEPLRDGEPLKCFLKIMSEEDALTYEIIRDYMAKKFNRVVVDRNCAIKYLKDIDADVNITEEMDAGNGKIHLIVHQSLSAYSTVRSAVAWVYRLARVEMPFANELSIYLVGLKRCIASAKQHLGLKITEGKAQMTEEAYELIAEHLFRSEKKEDILYHLIFLLDWNLMKRAENCMNAKMIHIDFVEDHLVFKFAKEKTKQHGDIHGPWHCFANPEKPYICLMLAFARYLLTFPQVLQEGSPLFEGTNTYRRYSARLHRAFSELQDDLEDIGVDWSDLGTHSTRKGVATAVANGCTVGPPIAALCLRAGWKLGGVKELYIFRADAGDMAVGRRAAGHNIDTKEFAISCAYFDYSDLNEEAKIAAQEKLNKFLSSCLPNRDNIPPNSWNLVARCFASVCYKYEYLEENLAANSPFRFTAAFRDIPLDIKERATVKYPWNQTKDTPKFNGVPPHAVQLAKLESIEQKINGLEEKLIGRMDGLMTDRGFSSTQFKTEDLVNALMPMIMPELTRISEELAELKEVAKSSRNATDEGIDAADLCFAEDGGVFDEDLECVVDDDGVVDDETPTVEKESLKKLKKRKQIMKSNACLKKRKYLVGMHHNKLNVLPQSYVFPTMTPLMFVQNWLLGNVKSNVPPLATLTSKDVIHLPSGNKQRNKMVAVMRLVEKEARDKDVWVEQLSDWNPEKVMVMWNAVSPALDAKYAPKTRRKKEMTWSALYSNMSLSQAFGDGSQSRKKKKKKKRGRGQSDSMEVV